MKCICGGDLRVTETREHNNVVYRRRRCIVCGKRLFTAENFIPDTDGRKAISHYQTEYMARGGRVG